MRLSLSHTLGGFPREDMQRKEQFDYCLESENTLTRGIWMSFFDTEEAQAVMLAYAANGGPVDHRSSGPGSSGKSRLKAPAQPALLNGSLLFLHSYLETGIQQGEVQEKISISLNSSESNRINTHQCFMESWQ
jgi:hypothetical protein